jgi:HAD superfamily hydrolase (TIGR01509 family)
MIKAVIFDMDGLMIDSEIIHSKSYETVLKEYGVIPNYKKSGIVHTTGIGALDNWKQLIKQYTLNEKIDILIDKKRTVHQKLLKENLIPMSGLIPLLKLLKNNKFKIAIGSSANRDNINILTEAFNITHYFDAIVSGQSVTRRKPNPDIFLKAEEELKVSPNNCLVLEDAENGVVAAYAAGMKIIAVPNNYTKYEDFSKANNVVNSLKSVTMDLINSL